MDKQYVVSMDSRCFNNPNLISLDKNLFQHDLIKVFCNTHGFRDYVCSCKKQLEIMIISNDDIEAINLAATAKKDRSDSVVVLVSENNTGSLSSRATAACIDSVINFQSFKERLIAINNIGMPTNNNFEKLTDVKLNKVPNSVKEKNKTFVLSVLSSSGGTGKSSASALMSVLLQAAGINTLLIDADLQFGDCSNLLGAEKIISIDKFLTSNTRISKLKFKTQMPSLLSALDKPELTESIAEKLPELINYLKGYFDAIIVNTGSYWNELQALLLENDSKSIFLVDQRSSSISSTKRAIDLCSRCGIATGSMNFVLNRCSKRSLFSSIDVSYALNGLTVNEILDGGLEVDESLSSGNPWDLIKSNNPFAVSLWALLEKLLPNELLEYAVNNSKFKKNNRPSVKNRPRGFFRRRA